MNIMINKNKLFPYRRSTSDTIALFIQQEASEVTYERCN